MTSGDKQNMHVLIIGAGIAGLLVAQGLKKEGIPFTVFESEASSTLYRPREWGMSIQWGLPLLQDCLSEELFQRLYTAANDPSFEPPDPGILPTLNGQTGDLMKNIPLLRMYRVSRRKFRKLCSEGIDIQYGKAFKSMRFNDKDNTVTAVFHDATEATGTLLIGADGAQSPVRIDIFGAEKGQTSRMPYTAVNLLAKYGDADKSVFVRQKHPIMSNAVHPDGLWLFIAIQDVPDPNDPSTWSFQLQCTWHRVEGEDATSLSKLKEKAETWCEPFKSAFQWVPEGTTVYENKISYWHPIPWDSMNGRVIIIGDAAHPMSFQRGQGMNHGIADASSIVKKLKNARDGSISVQEAVAQYQTEMIDRAGDEVKVSFVNTEMLHDWNRMAQSAILQRGGHPRDKKEA